MKKHKKFLIGFMVLGMLLCFTSAQATLLTFEEVPDWTDDGVWVHVGETYASLGVHFTNAVSLTAGGNYFNSVDFPPHSGVTAIGDVAPIRIAFDSPANDISAYFTYVVQLTFTAYDFAGNPIGEYKYPDPWTTHNRGSSDKISLDFSDVSSLIIAGELDGHYMMDDFSFVMDTQSQSVPEPATMLLFVTGLVGVALSSLRKRNSKS